MIGTGATVLGDLFILINATSYGIYLVIVKPLMRKYSAVTVMAWCFLFGLFFVLPFGWSEFGAVDRYALTTPLWIALGLRGGDGHLRGLPAEHVGTG